MTVVRVGLKIAGWCALVVIIALSLIVIVPLIFWYGIWKGICSGW